MYKKHVYITLLMVIFFIVSIISLVFIVDPYFQYHRPFPFITTYMEDENARYQNYGIAKHFDYDAIITGTSMVNNFYTSEFDEIFDVNSIKTGFNAGTYKEVGDFLHSAFEDNEDIKSVIWSLDLSHLFDEKDYMVEFDFPTYLYDDNILNDVSYLLNKEVILKDVRKVLAISRDNGVPTIFDDYLNWTSIYGAGAEYVLDGYIRVEKTHVPCDFDEEKQAIVHGNISQNIISVLEENPDTTFNLFFTPYSILWFDTVNRTNELQKYIDGMEYAASLMLEYDNIKLFSFFSNYELIGNIENYKDIAHYSEHVNSMMLTWMDTGVGQLTKDNYQEHFKELSDYYNNFNYDEFYAGLTA